jgi:hypothetical protein|tara:strand:+ start:478 stop:918 length:441 start_codon:yes stop_codon:yes gene_type:complete
MSGTFDRPVPGDIIAVDTGTGTAYVQITHLRAPYPDVLRAINPVAGTGPEEIAKGNTAFVAMVELARALADPCIETRIIGHATIPPADRAFPLFRMPIRNKAGDVVYWWTWNGEALAVAPDAGETDLPIREILPLDDLRKRLTALV